MNSKQLNKLILASLFAALCCIGTMIIHIPTANGYLHPGDGFVFLAGILLGPIYGGLAAGIGSCLADLFTGYVSYVLPTFIIKGLAAFIAGLLYLSLCKTIKRNSHRTLYVILSCILGALPIIIGYYGYEAIILGVGFAAASGIPGNIIQTVFGTVIATLLYPILQKIPTVRTLLY